MNKSDQKHKTKDGSTVRLKTDCGYAWVEFETAAESSGNADFSVILDAAGRMHVTEASIPPGGGPVGARWFTDPV